MARRLLQKRGTADRRPGPVSEPDDDLEQIAADVLRYLAAHPDAADSIEGIVCCWLGLPCTAQTMANAERALADLTAARLVARRVLPGGRALYHRAAPRPRR